MALAKWDFDHAHSGIDFTVRHMLVSKVRGRFTKWNGDIQIDEQDPSKSIVTAKIEVASVDTHEAQRDAHLRSPDFFDAANHPTIDFQSKRITKKSDDHYELVGDLTIRGTTREVSLDVERGGLIAKDPWGKRRVGFTATGSIDRKEFGVSFNQVLDQGGLALGEKVSIAIEVELTAAVVAQAAEAVS